MTLSRVGSGPTRFQALDLRSRHAAYAILFPLGVFFLTRMVAAIFVILASPHQIAIGPGTFPTVFVFQSTPADPGYAAITANWDGQWYQSIATDGYQVVGPAETATFATVWAWAFPPVYPLLVGGIMHVTGLSFGAAAGGLSVAAGAAAMVLLFKILDTSGGRCLATSGVILVCCFVSAPLFQTAYSESLALLMVLGSLHLISKQRYWLAILPTVGLSYTRLVTPVLCVVVVISVAQRIRRGGWQSISTRTRWGAIVLVLCGAAGAFAWPTTASLLMGDAVRFNRTTQLASGWGLGWFGGAWSLFGWSGLTLVATFLAVLLWGAFNPRSRSWGIELRTWSASYPAYILAVTPITFGVLRYMLLAPTLGLLLVGRVDSGRTKARKAVSVTLAALFGLGCQWLYVRYMLVIDSAPLVP